MATRRSLSTLLSISSPVRFLSISSSVRSSLVSSPVRFTSISSPVRSTLIPLHFLSSYSSVRSPLSDPSPNWSNRPPKETILLDGCDYEHWLIVMDFESDPDLGKNEGEMVKKYVETLAKVVGSEEEAKKKIYSVCTTTYTGFGALISEELSYKIKELPGVLWVLPDSFLDVPNKDYGGDLFIDGKVIHRPQFRFDDRQQTRSRNRNRR